MKAKVRILEYAGYALPLLLALVCIVLVSAGSHQASMPVPMPQQLIGEYSYDGETWLPLTGEARLPATEGNLYLRGCFERNMEEGSFLRYFRNHIGVTMYVNGERIYMDAVSETAGTRNRLFMSMCGQEWGSIRYPSITQEDQIVFHLYNPHRYGNESAYRDFLTTLCGDHADWNLLPHKLESYGAPFRLAAGVCVITALAILGAAIAAAMMRIPVGKKLLKQGLITLLAGGYIYFDCIDASFRNELVVLNTYGKQLCMMMAVFCLGHFAADALSGVRQRIVKIALGISSLLNAGLILAAMTGFVVIYDTLLCWVLAQLVFCLEIAVCCVAELVCAPGRNRLILISGLLLNIGVMLDIFGVGESIVWGAPCTKLLFAVLFVVYIVDAARAIVLNHWATVRAEKLETELEDSRIAIMLSQIHPHFLYNVLGTIRGLCRENPNKAWQALGDFSDYLRGNMSALTNSRMIPFANEFRHIEAYLRLEKMRMGDKLNILYDIQEKDFMIPPLTVQPLVENAVKHGLFEQGGGLLILNTRREDDRILISVHDDGVGFDESAPLHVDDGHAHIGLSNVRSRLKKMSGGQLMIESAPGQGTTATIILHGGGRENGGEAANEHTGR